MFIISEKMKMFWSNKSFSRRSCVGKEKLIFFAVYFLSGRRVMMMGLTNNQYNGKRTVLLNSLTTSDLGVSFFQPT